MVFPGYSSFLTTGSHDLFTYMAEKVTIMETSIFQMNLILIRASVSKDSKAPVPGND